MSAEFCFALRCFFLASSYWVLILSYPFCFHIIDIIVFAFIFVFTFNVYVRVYSVVRLVGL